MSSKRCWEFKAAGAEWQPAVCPQCRIVPLCVVLLACQWEHRVTWVTCHCLNDNHLWLVSADAPQVARLTIYITDPCLPCQLAYLFFWSYIARPLGLHWLSLTGSFPWTGFSLRDAGLAYWLLWECGTSLDTFLWWVVQCKGIIHCQREAWWSGNSPRTKLGQSLFNLCEMRLINSMSRFT